MQSGAVWLRRANNSRRLRRAKTELHAGDSVSLYYNAELVHAVTASGELVANEGDYSVWYKPGGVFTQGTKWGDANSIERMAELALNKPVKIVHRLDRHTSGLILFAHNKRAAAALSALFAERRIQKQYQAVVRGDFPGGEQVLDDYIDGKPARSLARCQARSAGYSLVDVSIETGRKHQIRRHLAAAGFPIVGDRLHGIEAANSRAPLQLCAASLSFICPLTQLRREYESPHVLSLEKLG